MNLPQITVTRPKLRFWQWLALRLSPVAVVAVAGIVAGIAEHNSGMSYGALLAVGAAVVILGIEIPLILYLAARHRRKLLESSPPGTLFAANGTQIGYLTGAVSGPGASRRGIRSGRMTIDGAVVSFRLKNRRSSGDTSLAWSQIAQVDVTPGKSPAAARMRVVTADGQTVTWLVPAFERLSAALDQLKLHQESSAGP